MSKIVIIDDEPLARGIIIEYLMKYEGFDVVAECNNGYEGLKALQQFKPDLIFLDIQMPKINGFEMLELLDYSPSVIFTTAFDQYAIKAFETNAVDYLLKPFSKERFNSAIEKWLKTLNQVADENNIFKLNETNGKYPEESTRIVVRTNSEITIVPVNEVLYFEAYDDYVKIFTKTNYYLKKKTMNYYEEILDKNRFFRTHRSFIINLDQLNRIEPLEKNTYVALLTSGKRIPLSRNGYVRLKDKLGI